MFVRCPNRSRLTLCSDAQVLRSIAVWSFVLLFFPRVLLFAASDVTPELSSLESFLAIHFGLFLAGTAMAIVFNVKKSTLLHLHSHLTLGQIPASADATVPVRGEQRGSSPALHPLIYPISICSLVSAFVAYNTKGIGALSTLFAASTGSVGIFGLWTVSIPNSRRGGVCVP